MKPSIINIGIRKKNGGTSFPPLELPDASGWEFHQFTAPCPRSKMTDNINSPNAVKIPIRKNRAIKAKSLPRNPDTSLTLSAIKPAGSPVINTQYQNQVIG